MPLGTEVGLGPGHIVLVGDSALSPPPQKGAQQPHALFGPLCSGARRTKATPCVEVRQTSNLRPLRLGEERKKRKKKEQTTG